MKSRDYDSVVYYADHPAAIAICRKRGCKEEYLKTLEEVAFYLRLNHSS